MTYATNARTRWTAITLGVALAALGFAAPRASAITLTTTHSVSGTYPYAGGTVDVTVTVNAAGTGSLLSLGLAETIPSGWTYNSQVSGPVPVIAPATSAAGPLEFAWSTVPTFPMSFVYRLNVPAGGAASQTISGYALGMDNLGVDIEGATTSVQVSSDNAPAMPVRVWPVLAAFLAVGLLVSRTRGARAGRAA